MSLVHGHFMDIGYPGVMRKNAIVDLMELLKAGKPLNTSRVTVNELGILVLRSSWSSADCIKARRSLSSSSKPSTTSLYTAIFLHLTMTSQGRVRLSVRLRDLTLTSTDPLTPVTNNATFDGTVYVFKNAGTYYLLGTIRVGERKTFPINVVQSGINNGDDRSKASTVQIRARILSTQGADNTDSVLVTYVSNSANQAEYIVSGTAGDPKINFSAIAPMTGGPSPHLSCAEFARSPSPTERPSMGPCISSRMRDVLPARPIRVGETQTFRINEVQSGVNNGDDVSGFHSFAHNRAYHLGTDTNQNFVQSGAIIQMAH
ncbi:hypothetical protein IMY05_C4819000100 [Salix suchowensis]|nr:hypothetical protein IMY05_C4819000100 [Salix suchowensis]